MSLSRTLSELTKGTNVTVNTILAGSTKTEGVKEFVQNLFPSLPYEKAERKFMDENRSTSLIGRLINQVKSLTLLPLFAVRFLQQLMVPH